MFGYVVCQKEGLEQAELDRYQQVYCGLCRQLGKRFGQGKRMTLSYDLTFLALVLSSLYEPEEKIEHFRCAVHPRGKKKAVANPYLSYAADMTIALYYYKSLDDWQDEKHVGGLALSSYLKKSFQKIQEQYPRQCQAIAKSVSDLRKVEEDPDSIPDEAVNYSGRMLEEVFVYQEDFWADSLRTFGYELGRFIYLMDAVMDYEKDKKNGSYNPLLRLGRKPEEMEETLKGMIGRATEEFERLPMVQDAHLIRNILYAGVWQKYHIGEIKGEEHGK